MKTRKPIRKLAEVIAALMMILCAQTAAFAETRIKIFFRKMAALSVVLIALICIGGTFSPVFSAMPDTGQSKCYNDSAEITCPSPGQEFYGQDGNYSINPPSYTKLDASGNALSDSATSWAMVKDNVTGLIWENKTTDGSIHDSATTYNWADAQNVFIAQLNASNFGRYSDWRLPTREELRSIVDISRNTPVINLLYAHKYYCKIFGLRIP